MPRPRLTLPAIALAVAPLVGANGLAAAPACDWYAVLHCSADRAGIEYWVDQTGIGRIAEPGSPLGAAWPSGHVCAVMGPYARSAALDAVEQFRLLAPNAHAETICAGERQP
ncbi:hypothetical protein [Prosthecodimorpha staleyi]|uniref:Secreted protein n=1 Tax=Prosthecodimorpha staleyi TaxID=2840188 RepID=A0A947D9E6_9HYPH|nr:hypothetical protein [Prosthecodimorpha staleyi]MBT9293200.1 hypothetical protein [Prosthecodimorpha staleyi]